MKSILLKHPCRFFSIVLGTFLLGTSLLQAHCQIPCGIYNDHARVTSMLEDAATIEKAVLLLESLAGKTDVQSLNQSIRWVQNKEIHAQKIIETISNYFLAQRINTAQDDYATRLRNHHAIIIAAMKAKQNATSDATQVLRESIQTLQAYYPAPEHTH